MTKQNIGIIFVMLSVLVITSSSVFSLPAFAASSALVNNTDVNHTSATSGNTSGITVTTDKTSYRDGDTVMISGSTQDYISDTPITVRIISPIGYIVRVDQVDLGSDRTFSTSITATGSLWKGAGTYQVIAIYGSPDRTAQTTFQFAGSTDGNGVGNTIIVDGTNLSVKYSITNGKVFGMKTDSQSKSLIVSIQTTGDGVLTATLPRALINAILPTGQDDRYDVLVDNQESNFQETSTTTTDRTLSIPFTDGVKVVEIRGTSLLATPVSPTTQSTNEIDIATGAGSSANAACVATNNCFYPNPLTVAPGTTVTWKNTDTAMHVICSGKSSDAQCGTIFEEDSLKPGQTFQFTFNNAGTYNYLCSVHPWMTGQVIVGAVTPTPTPQPTPVTISLNTDKQSYSQGDTIIATGKVSASAPYSAVTLKILNTHGNLLFIGQLLPAADGSFTKTFSITGPYWTDAGIYTITAQYGLYTNAITHFYYNGGDGSSTITKVINATYGLQSGNQIYNIPYIIKGGTVSSMNILPQQYTLEITSNTNADGSITVTIPRSLMDAKTTNGDINFIVTVGGQVTQFSETANSAHRTLSIPFHNGDSKIDIIGTQITNITSNSSNPYLGCTNCNDTNSIQQTPSFNDLLKQRLEDAKRLQALLHAQNPAVLDTTQQDIENINQAKNNQTIAAEVNIGTSTNTTSIDNNVSVKTTQNTPDSLGVQVSATNQTGPKVIAFNLAATTINVANLKDLGIMYDGKLISPAPNMDAILHAKPTDNPSFAIVVTQSGIQVLVLVPHFSTHTITITNMTKVIPVVPEFPASILAFIIATITIVLIPKVRF